MEAYSQEFDWMIGLCYSTKLSIYIFGQLINKRMSKRKVEAIEIAMGVASWILQSKGGIIHF